MATPRTKAPTLSDVARVAGVSLPTVARVVSDSPKVRESTKARVRAAMEEIGYRPNGAARALVQGLRPIIGVITPDTARFGSSQMLTVIEDRARKSGYVVAVTVLQPDELESNPNALDALLSQPILGVIILEHNAYDPSLLRVNLRGIPSTTVTYSVRPDADLPHVLVDDRIAAKEVTEHLLSLGHRTVHHVASNEVGHPRELGWLDALQEANAPAPAPVRTDWTLEAGFRAGTVLASDPDVTAIFCSNDEVAFGLLRGLHEAGRIVPEDISVAGIDDHPHARAWVPSLTTYRLDWAWAGAAAYELLVDSVGGLSKVGASGSGLILRESTSRHIDPADRSRGDRSRGATGAPASQ